MRRKDDYMKALILAAGRGTRISRYLQGRPKCTVDIGGEQLIHYTVRTLIQKGVKDIRLVLGYRDDAVRRALADLDVGYYVNPFFDVTNSIASAWFAREFIDGDMLMMNADVFAEGRLFDFILSRRCDCPTLFSDETRREEADYKLCYNESGLLEAYGKELDIERTTGEYIGIARVPAEFSGVFRDRLCEMILSQQHGVWWENVLYSLSSRIDIRACDIDARFWAEVDYVEDYDRILGYIRSRGTEDSGK